VPIPGDESQGRSITKRRNSGAGFTLVELVIIIVVLGIVAAVAIPRMGSVFEQTKINATREELLRIKKAITGDSRLVSGGELVDRGFEGDVGFPPSRLEDLVTKPDTIPAYDKFTRLGWNGPYLDSTGAGYLSDAWNSLYQYNPMARQIISTGATPDITVTF